MDTRWKRFSRSRGCKLAAFLVFVLAAALLAEGLILLALRFDPDYGLEPVFCEEYEQSDYQMATVQEDVVAVLNEIGYVELEDAERYQEFLQDYELEDTLEHYREFQGSYYDNWGSVTVDNARYYAQWEFDGSGETRTLGNMSEEELPYVVETGLCYTYDGGLSCDYPGVPTPEIYYNEMEHIQSVKIVIVYPQDWLTAMQKEWTAARRAVIGQSGLAAGCLVLALFTLIFLLVQTGRKAGETKAVFCTFDRMWTELTILLGAGGVIGCVLALAAQVTEYEYMNLYYGDATQSNSVLALAVLCGAGFALGAGVTLAALLSLVRKLKTHCFWKTSLTGKLFRLLWRGCKYLGRSFSLLFNGERFRHYRFQRTLFVRQLVFILGEMALWLAGGVCLGEAMFGYSGVGPVLTVIFVFLALLLLAWYVNGYARANEEVGMLCDQIDRIASGDLDSRLQLGDASLLKPAAEELNDIRGGMQKNIESQMKSERMKIELITNVSHDLKTPLTSIISYIDLLQKEELDDEARDYVNILAQKSERLKNMVADVFDLAKTTSGEATLELERLDLRKLLEQTLADMEDRIAESGRSIRLKLADAPAQIEGDGSKLYRVFQNLIDNALKYSMEGTRIYIEESLSEDGRVAVSVKNTASYEMEFTEEEIMERFARGDKSRTTEGNGLGLSIAKSFAEVCGGTFSIRLDGDQFGATVSFQTLPPLPEEDTDEDGRPGVPEEAES